jgi:helicase
VTTELDDTYLPINKKSKSREPMRWLGGLQQQGVATRMLQIDAREVHTATLRAKKAMACLLWMRGQSREQIETTLTQHMRENVAAGAVTQVRSRTQDLLPVAISVAEILRDVDLAERQDDLMLRLELGIPADLLPVARLCRGRLTRAEYLRLRATGLGTVEALADVKIEDLAERLGGDGQRAKAVRELAGDARKQQQAA